MGDVRKWQKVTFLLPAILQAYFSEVRNPITYSVSVEKFGQRRGYMAQTEDL